MRESIIYSSLRVFFKALFVILGILLGIILVISLIEIFSSKSADNKLTTSYAHEILPNEKNEREVLGKSVPVILQIDFEGVIGTSGLDAESIRQQLIESREGDLRENRVKALLLYINTPGGTVRDADDIFHYLIEYKQKYKVPIYAYVDGLCASGGMYIALAADKIFSTSTSLIGSVGVIAPTFMNFTKLLEKIGVDTLTISAGKGKDGLNPLRPWKEGEDENYRQIINYYYEHFVNLVVENRPAISREKLVEEYGAHVFVAPTALQYGFIDNDDLSLNQVLAELRKAAGIEEEENYQFIKFQSKNWLKNIFSNQSQSQLLKMIFGESMRYSSHYLYLYSPAH